MPNKFKCEICNKEIEHGNICNECSRKINEFIIKIKESLKQARERKEYQKKDQ